MQSGRSCRQPAKAMRRRKKERKVVPSEDTTATSVNFTPHTGDMEQADRAGSTASVSSGRDARGSRRRLCDPWEMNLRVPDVVANAAAACGADGCLRGLRGLIAELEAELSVSVV